MPDRAKRSIAGQLFNGTTMVLATCLFLQMPVQAVTAGSDTDSKSGITISPSLKDLTLSSGLVEAKTNVTITNRTGRDLTGTVKVVDFRALSNTGAITLGEVGLPVAKYSLANWMVLPSGTNVSLPKGQATEIPVNVQNRSDLAPGGHYGAVVVTASTTNDAANLNKVGFRQELVSLVFVKKLGGEQYGLELKSFDADARTGIPTTATMLFGSTGNVQVVPRGYVEVADPKGKVVAKGLINPESTLVLPETSRQFITILQPVAAATAPGRYTVTAYYRYDEQTEFRTKSVYTYQIPPLLTAAFIIIVCALIALIIWLFIFRFKRKKYKL